jgi:hypothetical protein
VLANFTRSGHRSELRRRRRETEVAAGQGQAGESAPRADELLERHEAARVVAALVSGLGEPHRGLVLLRFAEGLTPKEIARRQGVPEGTVRRQFKEALDQLRAAVAAHYDRDARDWRLALVPLVHADGGNQALAGALKGMASMALKSKTKAALGLGLAALLALVTVGWRWWPRDPDPGSATAPKDQEARLQDRSPSSSPSSVSPAGGGPRPPASPAAAPAPPTFTVRAEADWPACQDQLTALRAQASGRALVSPAAFESAPPSPRTEREVAPIVAAVMSRLPGKPSYQIECRASLCRIGSVTDPAEQGQPPTWLRGLGQDQALTALRGNTRSARVESVPTRDALTGATLLQHWLYFNVPLAAGEEHPLEGAAKATTCGQRVAAIQRALDEQRDEGHRQRADQAERQRRFQAMPVNQELTRKMEAAFRPFTAGKDGAPAGAWECRGQQDCRWSGPASVGRSFGQGKVEEALASQGLSAEQVMARMHPPKEGAQEGDAELQLRLADGSRPDGGAPPDRRRVMVENVSTEPNRD